MLVDPKAEHSLTQVHVVSEVLGHAVALRDVGAGGAESEPEMRGAESESEMQ